MRHRIQNRFLLAASLAWLISLPATAQVKPGSDTLADPHHPPATKTGRHAELSKLTDSIAPAQSGEPAAPVARRNFVDEFIFSKLEKDGVPHAPLADDAAFYRRIHLDLTGRIPDADKAKAFVASSGTDKRDKLIDELVGSVEFRERFTYWFMDQWRASQNRIGTLGRNLFYSYIYDSLQINVPYDELVREMLSAKASSNWYVGPASYLVRWVVLGANCTETAPEDTADDLTVNVFRNFMGINLQCVSCHDGANHLEKMNVWLTARKREEFWAQAAFFGNTRIERRVELANTQDEYLIDDRGKGYAADAESFVRIKRVGEGQVQPAFILSGEKPRPGKPLREELGRILTSHPQFARATVNSFWAELMGAGIVDPPAEFDLARLDPKSPPEGPWTIQPTHPELLEALTKDFMEHGYDLQRLIKTIAKSSTYQLSSSFQGEWNDSYGKYFARRFVRRLSAEQVHDAIVKASGLTTKIQIPKTDIKVDYLVQTRDPYDVVGNRYVDRKLREELEFFLESFGHTNREFNEPTREGSIIQAVLMMNSSFVKSKSQAAPGSYLATLLAGKDLGYGELIGNLFWRYLTRGPDEREQQQAFALLADQGRKKGAEDLQWLLMNKVEFIFNN